MGKLIDITGQRFGRLTVIERSHTYRGMVFWKCACDCGKQITASSGHLRYGHTTSCGCYASDLKRHPNKYELKEDYGICFTNNGNSFLFDIEDYDKIKDYTWVISTIGYAMSMRYKDKPIMFHRFVMDCPEAMVVDHINHNTLDNRKSNLRVCTPAQNQHNRKTKGVIERRNKWEASIIENGNYHYLGIFDTEEEATNARRQAEQKYYGEFAYKGD